MEVERTFGGMSVESARRVMKLMAKTDDIVNKYMPPSK